MDQVAMVNERAEAGRRLVEAVAAKGYEVGLAFWAKPTDEGKWYLYLASRFVDDKGPLEGYRLVLGVMRSSPDPWVQSLDVRVLGMDDSLTASVLARASPWLQSPRQATGIAWFDDITFGGVNMDAAGIYPPAPAA